MRDRSEIEFNRRSKKYRTKYLSSLKELFMQVEHDKDSQVTTGQESSNGTGRSDKIKHMATQTGDFA